MEENNISTMFKCKGNIHTDGQIKDKGINRIWFHSDFYFTEADLEAQREVLVFLAFSI